MKTKKLETLERYTSVAVRAKLSVEVEQKKRLGAWGKRVLVLDGATLYAYKTKGDGGSVGGWAIGGADVHVRRNSNDSNRDDGRHILVITRPPVYKLVFAFSTIYEQARMIQALSSSGATVTGLDAIMLLKNLRQQQEQEKEQEARQRVQSVDTSQDNNKHDEGVVVTSIKEGDSPITINDEKLENGRKVDKVEVNKTGQEGGHQVSNPLYFSLANLSNGSPDQADGNLVSSSKVSKKAASRSQAQSSADEDTNDKVNPLPKPPRASISEGSPQSAASLFSDGGDERQSFDAGEEEGSSSQSILNSDQSQEDSSSHAESNHQGGLVDPVASRDGTSDQTGNSTDFSENTVTDLSDDESDECEGSYDVNPDPEVEQNRVDTSTDKEEETQEENFEHGYVELVSKMKLERGISIDNDHGGNGLDPGSPDGVRRILEDSPRTSKKSSSPVADSENDRQTKSESSNSVLLDEILSDSDEKFEQLYRELSSNGSTDVKHSENSDTRSSETVLNTDNIQHHQDSERHPDVTGNDDAHLSDVETAREAINEEDSHDGGKPSKAHEEALPEEPLKRVNSIIKKHGSPSSGKSKKVQFNLEATTIEPGTSSPGKEQTNETEKRKEVIPRTLSLRKSKKESVSSETSGKKKLDDVGSPGPTPSPSKKKGIFSNMFSSSSKKSNDAASSKSTPTNEKDLAPVKQETNKKATNEKDVTPMKQDINKKATNEKDVPPVKQEANKKATNEKDLAPVKQETNKKAAGTSPAPIKRQPTVDLTAPLIIGGSVEMGGSVSGKVTPRRIEVRDGHVLAFMPKALSPTSRLSLVGLSVTPLIGGIHSNALSLTRTSRCMMVIKLSSRDEMMHWINILSDEVINITPENQRIGLVLYPSPKKDESEPEKADEPEKKNEKVKIKSQEPIESKNTAKMTNGHVGDHTNKVIGKGRKEDAKTSHSLSNGKTSVNGHNGVDVVDEDTSDGWLRKKKPTGKKEFEMTEIKKSDDTALNRKSELKMVEEHFKEEKNDKTVRKINKLNIEERWKELKNDKNSSQKENSQVQRRSLENKHPPLRRLSAQEYILKKKSQEGPAGNLLFINNPPKGDYHANCHPPLERLSNRKRIISASESNLQKVTANYSTPVMHHLHKSGSELTLSGKPDKEFNNNNMDNSTKDTSNVLVSSRILRTQANATKNSPQPGKINGMSPTNSPSQSRYRRASSYEPREVEIIETKKYASNQELQKISEDQSEHEDQWFEEDEHDETENQEPTKDNLPQISWSVSATREKFELLCSVSGENKVGKLTTKTPISRKKSSIKKRRSLEATSGRRPTSLRNAKRPSSGTNRNLSNQGGTDIYESSEISELETSSEVEHGPFKLQPVRDRRKTFENEDVVDGSKVSLPKSSSSSDLVRDTSSVPLNDTRAISIRECPSPPESPAKSPLRRTHNVLQSPSRDSSSPEPDFISSKLINGKPKGNIPEQDKGIVSRSLAAETQESDGKDSDVVICWRGPYIAQEAEQAVLSNISNAFLAKRRLLSREVAVARIQEKLSALEESIWEIQASMAEIDKQSSFVDTKRTNNWKTLERSLRTAEEDMAHWTERLKQTQKEAEQAREKLAAALVTGLAQYNPGGGEKIQQRQRQKLVKMYTRGKFEEEEEEEDEEEDGEEQEEDDSFA